MDSEKDGEKKKKIPEVKNAQQEKKSSIANPFGSKSTASQGTRRQAPKPKYVVNPMESSPLPKEENAPVLKKETEIIKEEKKEALNIISPPTQQSFNIQESPSASKEEKKDISEIKWDSDLFAIPTEPEEKKEVIKLSSSPTQQSVNDQEPSSLKKEEKKDLSSIKWDMDIPTIPSEPEEKKEVINTSLLPHTQQSVNVQESSSSIKEEKKI